MPFFSVIIPLYNKAPYVRRSLDSVLAQSFPDFEVIVIDDGSTDEGASIVASYQDSRIRLIRQENAGVSAARNKGIETAKAAWLAFLDADDEYFSNFLEKMRDSIFKCPDCGFIFSGYLYTDIAGCIVKAFNSKYRYFQIIENYCDFLCEHSFHGALSSSIVIRKKVLQQAGCFPVGIHIAEDIDTWMRLGWISKAGFEPSCLAHIHNEVIGTAWILSDGSLPKQRYPMFPDILISSYNTWKQKGIFSERMENSWRHCLNGYRILYVRELIQYGDKKAAWRFFVKELKWDCWWKGRLKIIILLILPKELLHNLIKNIRKSVGPDWKKIYLILKPSTRRKFG